MVNEDDPSITSAKQMPPNLINSETTVDRRMLDYVTLRISPDAQDVHIDGETVLLHLRTGRYYTLNRLGSAIWRHCTGSNSISDIHAFLCERFEVSPEQALDDLVALINQLLDEGLLQQERR